MCKLKKTWATISGKRKWSTELPALSLFANIDLSESELLIVIATCESFFFVA